MNQPKIKVIIIPVLLIATAVWVFLPATDNQIMAKLKSNQPNLIVEAANEAADSQNRLFVPQLIKDSQYPWVSTDLHYKGFTVYTECMFALEDILYVKPPHKYSDILMSPDSVNIKFYTIYWQLWQKRKNK